MQILKSGSFLNLESGECVEALKFTARRLAEHSAEAVKENLNANQFENLANNLWDKAGYVTRETERRRWQQIFVENFYERLRELQTGTSPAENTNRAILPTDAVNKFSTVHEGEKDEFLGIVGTDERLVEEKVAENVSTTDILREGIEPTVVQNSVVIAKTESDAPVFAGTPHSESQSADLAVQPKVSVKADSNAAQTDESAKAAPAESKPQTVTNAGKSDAKTPNEKEPFEFEKCTINLNLTLLPMESGKSGRKVLVSAVSHNLPPEIDFLEIAEGGDLRKIADLVSEKLARFRGTLPVKYIEQLRTAKTKSAKSNSKVNATVASMPQTAANPTNAEKPPTETKAEENKTNASPAPTVNQSVTASEIQQSLF